MILSCAGLFQGVSGICSHTRKHANGTVDRLQCLERVGILAVSSPYIPCSMSWTNGALWLGSLCSHEPHFGVIWAISGLFWGLVVTSVHTFFEALGETGHGGGIRPHRSWLASRGPWRPALTQKSY